MKQDNAYIIIYYGLKRTESMSL